VHLIAVKRFPSRWLFTICSLHGSFYRISVVAPPWDGAVVCWRSLLLPGVTPAETSCDWPQHLVSEQQPSSSLLVRFISGAQALIALNLWSEGTVEQLLQLDWLLSPALFTVLQMKFKHINIHSFYGWLAIVLRDYIWSYHVCDLKRELSTERWLRVQILLKMRWRSKSADTVQSVTPVMDLDP